MSGQLTWLGHSTVLIELDGARVLTDPLLRSRVLHIRRRFPPPSDPGPIDAVLVSHVHWDHLDLPSLARFDPATPIFVPRGAGGVLRRFARVVELDAGERAEISGVEVHATPALHAVGPWRLGARSSAAVGFLVSGSRSVYFAGDTDVFDGMRELGSPNAALLPVGGWGSRLPHGHMDPQRAAEALRLVRPRIAVPIHWGTYASVLARPSETGGEEFRRYAREVASEVDVRVLPVGGRTDF